MSDYQDDPVYLDSRREAVFILILWCACFCWTIGFCYLSGYTEHPRIEGEVSWLLPDLSRWDRDPDSLRTPMGLGIPDWIFWGVAAPWGLCILTSTWFCFCYMKDDEEQLGDRSEPAEGGS